MLGENIKNIRKQRGMTQEELATRVHVVRQTVSKWEKELSVPDAATLQKIAEALECEVTELLGADINKDEDKNELAEQLMRINEQLAVRNRMTRRVIKGILIAFGLIVFFYLAVIILSFMPYSSFTNGQTVSTVISQSDPVYYDEEVQEAVDVLNKYFKKNYKGCTLENIDYNEDYSVEETKSLSKTYPNFDIMVFKVTFHTGDRVKKDYLEPNRTYGDWRVVLTRSSGENWAVKEFGLY